MSQEQKKTPRTSISDLPRREDLPADVQVLSNEEAALVAGGRAAGSVEPTSCTANGDYDYTRD